MSNCILSSGQISNLTASTLEEWFDEGEVSISSLISKIDDLIVEEFKQRGLPDVKTVVNAMLEAFNLPAYRQDNILGQFTESYLTTKLSYVIGGGSVTKAPTTERLYDTEVATRRLKASTTFIDQAYGSATEVRNIAVMQQNQFIVDSCIISRGFLPGSLGLVTTKERLNNNIRRYQQHLLNTICDYLKTQINSENATQEEIELVNNPILYIESENTFENSHILEKLDNLINRFLNPETFSPEYLRRIYKESLTHDDVNYRQHQKKLLDAFNANLFLKHFDTYISSKLKGLEIDNFGVKTGKDKYGFSDKINNLYTTWRTSDNIDPSKEVDDISKMLIETSPLYSWQNPHPISNSYLTFNDFTHIIGKIKAMGIDPRVRNVKFDNRFKQTFGRVWRSFSPITQQAIYGKSLDQVINLIRKNPIDNLHVVFELLTNQEFTNLDIVSEFFSKKDWNREEKNKLYSLYKSIFQAHGENNKSIKYLTDHSSENDYYGFLAQTADSIFKNTFIQFYVDEEGNTKTRLLTDLTLYNMKQQFKSNINTLNSRKFKQSYKTHQMVDFDVKSSKDNEGKLQYVYYKIPNTDITVWVSTQTGAVSYRKGSTVMSSLVGSLKNQDIINFLDEILPLNLKHNSNFIEMLGDISEDSYEQQLLNFASRILTVKHIQNVELENISEFELENKAKEIFGGGWKITYNPFHKQLDVVNDTDTLIINNIIAAQAMAKGLTTAAQVKNSSQAGHSLSSLSRLLGSFGSQWELENDSEDSASKHHSLRTVPGLFDNHYTINEVFPKNTSGKTAVKMTVSELAYSNFMLNFIPSFIDNPKSKDFIGNGMAAFLASVNSDKNTVGVVRVNLKTVMPGFDGKMLKDLNEQELQTLIAREFGQFYTKIYDNISADLNALSKYIQYNLPRSEFPDLHTDYLHNYAAFNAWWDLVMSNPELADSYKQFGDSPLEFIRYWVLKYNNDESKPIEINKVKLPDQLELVDQLHITQSKYKTGNGKSVKTIAHNNTLIAQIARFQPDYLTELSPGFNFENYVDSETFWKNKNFELVNSLLNAKFDVDLSKNTPETNYLKNNYPSWVRQDLQKMYIAKVTINGTQYPIVSKKDLEILSLNTGIPVEDILQTGELEVHPAILQHNYLDYYITQQWMNLTVGSFIGHKGKGNNVIEEEASRFQAQHKRNVQNTAQKQQFALQTLNGIPNEYKISVIEDVEILNQLLRQKDNEVKPYDGATFVNPFYVYLENLSLFGAKAGITKKQFVHFVNPRTGTSGIIKTAGFGITNDSMRNSERDQLMMQKMTEETWKNEDGSYFVQNIFESWNGQPIQYETSYYKGKDGKFYRLEFEYQGNNQYIRKEYEVDNRGNDLYDSPSTTVELIVDSNYTLWKMFGGERSMHFNGNNLEFSETSITNVVKAMNKLGVKRINPITNKQYDNSEITTQEQLYQPLKHSDIAYMPTMGAVKSGAANVNSVSKFNDDVSLTSQVIHTYESGIQLDKEHHATDAELSLPTQIVSACVSKGFSIDEADRLYKGLRQATEIGIKEYLDATKAHVKHPGQKTTDALNEAVFKLVINNLSTASGQTNFANLIASDIIKQLEADPNLKFSSADLPLSDNTVFRKVLSSISSYLTSEGIRIKIPGLLAVLNPSHDRFKLYADRKLETFDDPETELQELQDKQRPVGLSWIEGDTHFEGFNLVYAKPNSLKSSQDEELVALKNPHDGSILIDEALLRQKFEEKAWRNSTNSAPLSVDFETYEDWVLFCLTREKMYDLIKIKEGQIQYDYETSINEAALNAIDSHVAHMDLQRTYNVTRIKMVEEFDDLGNGVLVPVPVTTEEYIENPSQLKQLRKEIEEGTIVNIIENVKVGRNLGAYNVRFYTESGKRFQLWELDSVELAHEFAEVKESNFQQWYAEKLMNDSWFAQTFAGLTYKQCKNKINLLVQRDISALSKTQESPIDQYNNALQSVNNGTMSMQQLANTASLLLYRRVSVEEAANLHDEIDALSCVKIDGISRRVIRQDIEVNPYELIMPKTFKEEFGFDTYTDLKEVENDPDWFIKQAIRNKSTIDERQFDIALKKSNGKHIYILDESHLEGSNLQPLQNEIRSIEENGKIFRVDSNDKIMYELYPGTEIYNDEFGNEIFIIRGNNSQEIINKYVASLSFDTIYFSNNLIKNDPEYLFDLVTDHFELNNKRIGSYIQRKITPEETIDVESVINNIIIEQDIENVTEEDYKTKLPSSHPIIIAGRNKHTSFLKSLEITAARIPSQSKQSYMPMKVVAYDNPDLNNAYVSTLQILLQGSDFDIDAVSLVTYDIDDNGLLQTWSPYTTLTSKELLEESLKLPIPSGFEAEIIESDNRSNIIPFWRDFNKLFKIHRRKDKYELRLKKITSVEQIQLLKELVQLTEINKPTAGRNSLILIEALRTTEIIDKIPEDVEGFIDSIYNDIKQIIDKHNLYFSEVSSTELSTIVNNINAYSLYQSIIDPSDLIQSQESVDGPTEPIKDIANDPTKSNAAKEAKRSTPGNNVNKLESILQNSEGKDGIAISAVALKGFFAITYYMDSVLNSGDSEAQSRLFSKRGDVLANIRAKNPSTVVNQEVVDILIDNGFQEDQAIQLSALLGLSADNAKELALAKLNAGSKTISLYLYGLSIGMEFSEISDLMMGKTGRLIREIMDGDVYKETREYISVIDAISYFEKNPSNQLSKYNVSFLNGKSILSPLSFLSKNLGVKGNMYDALTTYLSECRNKKLSIHEVITKLHSLREDYKTAIKQPPYTYSADAVLLFNRLIDFAKEYALQYYSIDFDQFEKIKFLAEGANEMKRIGEIAGLNQGLPTQLPKLINKINAIEGIFEDNIKTEQQLNDVSAIFNKYGFEFNKVISLEQFAFDDKYRKACIEAYDAIKHTFNVLDVVSTSPHIMGYIQALTVAKVCMSRSYKFRSIINNYRHLSKTFGANKNDVIKGLENYIGDKIISDWMLSKTVIIPAGNYIFDENGKISEKPLEADTSIQLGTDWGNATFRLWMENEVIPNLKAGKVGDPNMGIIASSNKFVQDIGASLRTNTTSGNSSIVQTLPINMMPANESEQMILDEYIDEFNQLSKVKYSEKLQTEYSVIDLFTYYTMIAFNWKQSGNSLVNIFQNQGLYPLLKEFHRFESMLDKSQKDVLDELFFEENIIPYMASKSGPFNSLAEYVWANDKSTETKALMKKLEKQKIKSGPEELDDNQIDDQLDEDSLRALQSRIRGNYKFKDSSNLDSNYFPNTTIKKYSEIGEKGYVIEGKRVLVNYTWNKGVKNDSIVVIINGNPETLSIERMPTTIKDGIIEIDFDTLRRMIVKLKFNPC